MVHDSGLPPDEHALSRWLVLARPAFKHCPVSDALLQSPNFLRRSVPWRLLLQVLLLLQLHVQQVFKMLVSCSALVELLLLIEALLLWPFVVV